MLSALRSAEALVALITTGFNGSKWTDQEVGFVMGRGKLVVSVRLDNTAPYGFIGRGQAINGRARPPLNWPVPQRRLRTHVGWSRRTPGVQRLVRQYRGKRVWDLARGLRRLPGPSLL